MHSKRQKIEHNHASHPDSEIRDEQTATLERHEMSKMEDRVQCPKWCRYSRPVETCCGCGRMLQGLTKEVKKQAEQRISSRFIMYVLGIHKSALKNIQGSRRCGNSAESQKHTRARDNLNSAKKHTCGTIVERYFTDEQYQKRMHEQGYTQTDMEYFD